MTTTSSLIQALINQCFQYGNQPSNSIVSIYNGDTMPEHRSDTDWIDEFNQILRSAIFDRLNVQTFPSAST